MIDRNIFSERLKILKNKQNLNMVEVAKNINISKQSVFQWEKGLTIPTSDKLLELAILLDVSIDYLVGRTDKPEVNK